MTEGLPQCFWTVVGVDIRRDTGGDIAMLSQNDFPTSRRAGEEEDNFGAQVSRSLNSSPRVVTRVTISTVSTSHTYLKLITIAYFISLFIFGQVR